MGEMFLDDGDVRLYQGDVTDVLAGMPDESVDCVVTSPPYWGLRSYLGDDHEDKPQELGLEPTPDLYVERIVSAFREVRRVLAPHGTCWLNLGDSYNSAASNDWGGWWKGGQAGIEEGSPAGRPEKAERRGLAAGLKVKDLVGIPWRVAFALQADGWWLRADIIWSKPNPMPESVTDRPTKAHEYLFLLTKTGKPHYWIHRDGRVASTQPKQEYDEDGDPLWRGRAYYFDQEAVREPHKDDWHARASTWRNGDAKQQQRGDTYHPYKDAKPFENPPNPAGRNVRSVWQIATQPYPEAHFATYPEELVRRCVLAGCPVRVCRVCGKPSERIVDERSEYLQWKESQGWTKRTTSGGSPEREQFGRVMHGSGTNSATVPQKNETVGWSDCGHNDWRPGTVLDPFIGSGTTCKVARDHGRHSIGIDLSTDYLDLAARRLQQLSLLT